MAPSHRSSPGREGIVNEIRIALSMSIKQIAVAAVAAFGLSLGAYSASAGPLNEASAPHAPSTFTLIGHGGGHGGGGHGGGGHGGGFHGGGFHGGGMRIGRVGGGHTAFYRGGRVGGRSASYRGGRGRGGYWRGGRWYGGWYAGGSCYANCLALGYGPGYCSVYSYNFCY
jgi:hypothetical protein